MKQRLPPNRYWSHDTTLGISTEVSGDRATYAALLNTLRRNGFTIKQDAEVSHLIRRDYHVGSRGDLHVYCNHYPTGAKIEFYQEIVTENPYGGRYDFSKFQKMPYLIRLRFLWEKRCLESVLRKRGFVSTDKPLPRTAYEAVEQKRQNIRDQHGQDFYQRDYARQYGNATDADGNQLHDGDVRYFYLYGHLQRGVVYHNLNNMWWVVINRTYYHNVASFHLFAYNRDLHSKRRIFDPAKSIKFKLDKAVKEQNFEKAIGLRDALRRLSSKKESVIL